VALIGTLLLAAGCGPQLQPWHTEKLTEEFTAAKSAEIASFEDYTVLEDRLFAQLDEKVYARVDTGPEYALARYSAGSLADPREVRPDWNRSFELIPEAPVGGVLLLHGMSDSPYSLRALAETLHGRGYWVVGLRMPGHGTAPSGMRHVKADDMTATVRIGMRHLTSGVGEKPIHMIGYSTGAPLALEFALDALDGDAEPEPASIVLISPAIRIHPVAGLARFKNGLAAIPGLGGLAWTQVQPEFDPYKYNSFTTRAADVVHRLTRSVDRRVAARANPDPDDLLPPILVLKSTVDDTVTTDAVVDNLLKRMPKNRNELVLFDINRSAAKSTVLIADPGPLTNRLMGDATLPFAVTLITNESADSSRVVARRKPPFAAGVAATEPLNLEWPVGVISLSHVALSFPPDDPLYGRRPPENDDVIFLGEMNLKGERGLLQLPYSWLVRMRYNPFYEVVEQRVLDWFDAAR
jgi:alpha-beta hydrolase superfamily lysophospholipase